MAGAPSVAIDVPATASVPYTATITFSEPVFGFALGDIAVGNGSAGSFTGSDGDTIYTALIAPASEGPVTVDVAAAVAQDGAGNDNTAAATATTIFDGVVARPGDVTIAVVSDVSDGTFIFTSPEPQLNLSVTTSNGHGQSPVVTIEPGTYVVTARLPDGFGLISGSCTDGDSTVDVGAKTATINLALEESVTCTFSSADSRTKTTQTIHRFLSRRADLLLNNGPDGNRQINRLLNRGGNSANSGGTGFAASTGSNRLPTSTAFKNDAAGPTTTIAGTNVARSSGGFGVFDAPLGLGAQDHHGNSGRPISTLPFGFSVNGERARSFSFATSFVQVANAAADAKKRKLGGGVGQLAALGVNAGELISPKQSDLDIWAEGHFTYFEDGPANSEAGGHFGVLYLGADYVLTPNLLVGALVQIDSMEQSSTAGSAKVDGVGWLAGPYVTARLSDNLFFQGRAAWGRSTNDISPFMTYTDKFDTERWLATGTLKGRWQHGALTISPAVSVGYVEERQESYTDSLGVVIPGQTVSIGQAKFGPEISHRGEFVNGVSLEPFASLEGIWTFSDKGGDELVVDTLAGNNELRGRVGLGVRASTAGGSALAISGRYDGIGDDNFESISGELRLAIPFQ